MEEFNNESKMNREMSPEEIRQRKDATNAINESTYGQVSENNEDSSNSNRSADQFSEGKDRIDYNPATEKMSSDTLSTSSRQGDFPQVTIMDDMGSTVVLNIGEEFRLPNNVIIGYDLDETGNAIIYTRDQEHGGESSSPMPKTSAQETAKVLKIDESKVSNGQTVFNVNFSITGASKVSTSSISKNSFFISSGTVSGIKSSLSSESNVQLSLANGQSGSSIKKVYIVAVHGIAIAGGKVKSALSSINSGMSSDKNMAEQTADYVSNVPAKEGKKIVADHTVKEAEKAVSDRTIKKAGKNLSKAVYNSKPATYVRSRTENVVGKIKKKETTGSISRKANNSTAGRAASSVSNTARNASEAVRAVTNSVSSAVSNALSSVASHSASIIIVVLCAALLLSLVGSIAPIIGGAYSTIFGFFFDSDDDIWSDYETFVYKTEEGADETNLEWTEGADGSHRIPDSDTSISENLSDYSKYDSDDNVTVEDGMEDLDFQDKQLLLATDWYSSLASYESVPACNIDGSGSVSYNISMVSDKDTVKEIEESLCSYINRIAQYGDEYYSTDASNPDVFDSVKEGLYLDSPTDYVFTGGISGINWRAFFACTQVYAAYVPDNIVSNEFSGSGSSSPEDDSTDESESGEDSEESRSSSENEEVEDSSDDSENSEKSKKESPSDTSSFIRVAYGADDTVVGPYGFLDPSSTNPFISYRKLFDGSNSGNANPFVDASVTLDGSSLYYYKNSTESCNELGYEEWKETILSCIRYKYYILTYDAIVESFYNDRLSKDSYSDWESSYIDKVRSGKIKESDVLYSFSDRNAFTDSSVYPNAQTMTYDKWKEYSTDCTKSYDSISHICENVKSWNKDLTGISSYDKAKDKCLTLTDDAVYVKNTFYGYLSDNGDSTLAAYKEWFDNLVYDDGDGNFVTIGQFITEDDVELMESLYDSEDLYECFPSSIKDHLENYTSGSIYSSLGVAGWEIMAFFVSEESGFAGARQTGGDGGKAYGTFQFDYRYSLVSFLKYCYNYDSDKYSMFKPYISCKDGDSKLTSQGMRDAWIKACDVDETEFTNLQYQYAYDNYYVPAAEAITRLGINVNGLCDSAKGAIWSASIQHGTGGCTEIAKKADVKSSMSDKEFIEALYDARISLHSDYKSRYTREKSKCISLIGAESSSNGSKILAYGETLLGLPYKWGATGPDAYDCSGFTQACYKSVGIDIPRTSSAQCSAATKVPVSQARVGDVLWYSGHVALYAGNGKTLEAPHSGDVISYKNVGNRFTYCLQFY